MSHDTNLLRQSLVADALISGATGLLMLLGAGVLDDLLAIPAALMRGAGLSLLPFAAALLHLARREQLPPPAIGAVIAINVAWVAASLLLLVSGWIAPNGLGIAFVVAQAVAVAVFAEVQYLGLRRSRAAALA